MMYSVLNVQKLINSPLWTVFLLGEFILQEILDILNDLHPEIDFKKENNLIEDGILDSFDIVSLVAELNIAFDIQIGAKDIIPENFSSGDAIFKMVQRLRE